MSIAEKLTTISENEQKVYDVGKQAAYDEFWDIYQNKGERINYLYAFAGLAWVDSIYAPKYPLTPSENASFMFAYTNITDTKVTIDMSLAVRNSGSMFANSKLVTIRKIIFGPENPSFASSFTNCSKLQHLTAEGELANDINLQWSPLTRESIESVMAVLSDTAIDKTATFNRAAVDAAFTADEWAALVATKPNWSVTLSS